MTDKTSPNRGRCRCGQVQFEVDSEPLITMACHCTGCQQMTSSAFSLSALYPSESFNITSGSPVIGGLHGATRHYFCGHCMSWLFTRPEGLDDFVNIRASLMEDAQSFSPFIETYTDEKLPWATTPATYSFSKFPPPEQFPALLAEFAK
ncbi:GFA family protein [Phormidium tenue FACHB-1052]|uniref:Aldehyde-activating protein n=2 Tax=Phormidium tenue TaxID=126344 RepID=A0A1U7J1H1_9CYAN|nr:GFA family protein [Phormidium tenue FACHB-1052]OKH45679.1 aldehyde-activating protein [Phormidium tenue NIES-30]